MNVSVKHGYVVPFIPAKEEAPSSATATSPSVGRRPAVTSSSSSSSSSGKQTKLFGLNDSDDDDDDDGADGEDGNDGDGSEAAASGSGGAAYQGATVIDAEAGMYFGPITVCDFVSLYPSIMIAFNLSYETLLTRGRADQVSTE